MAYNVASLIATAIILPLLGVVAVALRFYVRLHVKPSPLRADDWLIVVSCIIACALAANQIVGKASLSYVKLERTRNC